MRNISSLELIKFCRQVIGDSVTEEEIKSKILDNRLMLDSSFVENGEFDIELLEKDLCLSELLTISQTKHEQS